MDRSNPVHDLLKLPDEAIIKNQQVEIGKLKAYIDELENEKTVRHLETVLAKKNKRIESLKQEVEELKQKCNQIRFENNREEVLNELYEKYNTK